jgi:hypothetical protein
VCEGRLVRRPRHAAGRMEVEDPPGQLTEVPVEEGEGDGDASGVRRKEREHPHRLVELLPLEPDAAHAPADGEGTVVDLDGAQSVRHGPACPCRTSASRRSAS